MDFFRHHFVYANMNRWLREGKDVNAMLPYLMRYMGHSDVKNTLYYLHLVPDIYGGLLDRSRHSENLTAFFSGIQPDVFWTTNFPGSGKKAGIPFPPTAPRLTSALVFWGK